MSNENSDISVLYENNDPMCVRCPFRNQPCTPEKYAACVKRYYSSVLDVNNTWWKENADE